ncbi:MAG: aminotransferase class I/II-fold pyridoxal phosphate-dependent enzyme [Candidatus Magasanikbacteria bacterium]|nr:aminotransferase class I/II-fold pyridoxal phosphate-dependent enzyme [Candidatus Magasanikbacteria bacterium]
MEFSHLMRIEPSATIAINSVALQKKAAGERVYNLSVGEPILSTPDVVIEAALSAIQNADTLISNVRDTMQNRRDAPVKALSEAFQTVRSPLAGLYLFVSLSVLGVPEKDSVAFCEHLLREANVALVPGAAFGQDGYVRFSFGDTIENLVAGVRALHAFLKK